ncbi:trigger factor [Xiamenia xianingshaonis]|uniref:Trigger factor n=1 Tax=Xiamenia xianingshaonis TaxID=2682776 RepID=A0A9E6MS23_9ACTN|nr:trigger factor [Xiamenia xianingshaonis]QTU84957.1 trigger factor [Xiamenia xianingshaonis]
METKVEKLEDGQAKVTVTIDGKDVADRIKKTYKDFANRYNFPGFRKGKAPRKVIDTAVGKDAVAATVTDEIVNGSYPLAIDDARLYPISRPTFGETDLVRDGEPYSFDFTVALKPEFELTSYDNVEIELPFAEATEKEIEQQIESLREHYATYENSPANTKVKPDSHIELSMKATDDAGEPIPSLTAESRPYSLGGNLFPAEFDEQLLGLKKGQTAEFELAMPEDAPIMLSALQGKTEKVNFEVEIIAVKRQVIPELTDEWVKEVLSFDTVEDFRKGVADSITAQKGDILPRLKENACLEAVAERLVGEVPESLAEETESTLLQDFFQQLQAQGTSLDMYLAMQGITADQFKADVKQQAQDMAKQDMALDAWAKHYGIEATDEDVAEEFAKTGVEDPLALQAEWRQNGQLYLVRQGTLRAKAVSDLMDKAVVTEVESLTEQKDEKPKKAAKKSSKKAEKKEEEPAAEAE